MQESEKLSTHSFEPWAGGATSVPVETTSGRRFRTPPLGILGGMGGLASAEFVKTIYEQNTTCPEQDSPNCLLYSDPSFPDRTEAIAQGREDEVVLKLTEALETLEWYGCRKVTIACVTLHHFLPRVPDRLRRNVISLIDVLLGEVRRRPGKHLLLCTNGTRSAGILQRHPRWLEVADCIELPDENDQQRVHELIYQLKANRMPANADVLVQELAKKYESNWLIAGCTDLHLLTKRFERTAVESHGRFVDPLTIISKNLRRLLYA